MNTFGGGDFNGIGVGLSGSIAGGIGTSLTSGLGGMGKDEATLRNEKLDVYLRTVIGHGGNDPLPVIVQTIDGLKPEDKRTIEGLNGTIKDDLYIIKAFSADLTPKAIEMLILSPRIVRIFHDSEVHSVTE